MKCHIVFFFLGTTSVGILFVVIPRWTLRQRQYRTRFIRLLRQLLLISRNIRASILAGNVR